MKIALAQINTIVGDFASNVAKLVSAYHKAREAGAAIVVAPELATCGYPPRDLLAKEHFVDANLRAVEELAGSPWIPRLSSATSIAVIPKRVGR